MRALTTIAAAALLVGCSSPPIAEQTPTVALPERFAAQFASSQASPVGPWWHTFGDAGLARAVEQVLAQNLDLEQARLRVEQSRALADRSRSRALPRVDVGASASANRLSTQTVQGSAPGFDPTSSSVGADVTATWEPDFFGRTKAAVAADAARTQASEADAVALALSLSSETARRVIELRSLQAQGRLADEGVQLDEDLVSLVGTRLRGGAIAQTDLLRAQAQLLSTRASRERLKASTADALQALAVLLATTPADAAAVVGNAALPEPTGLEAFADTPAQVLAKRPDVAAAAFRLHAASADLASTAAERFPRVNLLASVGLAAASLSSLGTPEALLASFVPSLSWRALDFGELDAAVAGRKAIEMATAASYKHAVLTAFADAETALTRVSARQDELEAAKRAARTQLEVWEVARLQFERGVGELSAALEARRLVNGLERERLGSQQALAVAVVEGYRATAAGTVARVPASGVVARRGGP
jgi:NodT family efflux transporter outer membrane factor (OMF) lipoprotein